MTGDGEIRRLALITGASGGIGADLARIMAREGHDLALVARSADKLAALALEITSMGRPPPLVIPIDLARPAAGGELAAALTAAGAQVSILVNNAGFGLNGAAVALDPAAQLEMIDLNVRLLTDLTLRFAPDIIRSRGRILNVASVASFLPGPGMAVYYATKAFVRSFSLAMSEELKASGVTVTCLCPGFTATAFQARAGIEAATMARVPTMSSLAVAHSGYRAMMAGRRLVITGFANKLGVALLPFIPDSLLLPILAGLQMKRHV